MVIVCLNQGRMYVHVKHKQGEHACFLPDIIKFVEFVHLIGP